MIPQVRVFFNNKRCLHPHFAILCDLFGMVSSRAPLKEKRIVTSNVKESLHGGPHHFCTTAWASGLVVHPGWLFDIGDYTTQAPPEKLVFLDLGGGKKTFVIFSTWGNDPI